MSERYRYTLPTRAGNKLVLGQLIGSASAIECAKIIDRYPGVALLITSDRKSAMRLHDEILQLTSLPIITIPDWGTLPYDNFSPNKETISNRISILYRLPSFSRGVIILPINTLIKKVCRHAFLYCRMILISKGQYLSRDILQTKLEKAGYYCVHQVLERGEFSIHGPLLDLYPMGSDKSYRINFLNNKIESLRIFDINTQQSLQEVNTIDLLPVCEFPVDKTAIELFCRQWQEWFSIRQDSEHIYQQVSKGILPAGIEYWQPLFFNEPLVSLFSYLPENTLVINTSDLELNLSRFWDDIYARFNKRRADPMRPLLPPETLWLKIDNFFSELKNWPFVQLSTLTLPKKAGYYNMDYRPLPDLAVEMQSKASMHMLCKFCKQFNGPVVFSVENERRKEVIIELLMKVEIIPEVIDQLNSAVMPGTYLIISANKQGFIDASCSRALICESDLFGELIGRHQTNNLHVINSDFLIHNTAELNKNQLVVHLEYGIGRYSGMITLETGGIKAEYLILTYACNDKLYVPISSLHLISRYVGNTDENVPLNKLGSDTWIRKRKKATERIQDVAAELLDIYAKRAAKNGFAFRQNQENYQLFCEECPFELTIDQVKAINSVLSDMCQPSPMDRLICGDVGFGKTEVAMRAAFLAINNHKQVAVLVPTTLLAQQHFDNFRDRFANWPVRIEMISRFRRVKDQIKVLNQTSDGKVDILIGTHKLLQSDVKWHDLGLLILDEEHRFGVRHKERIKAMRTDIDILTLTATPIPRTLNMAMMDIRDLSIITTPPARRLAVKTFVREYDTLLVREAILREIFRGGQVYYISNNVENIEKIAYFLETLVPEARISIGHGQLRERELEQVINDFHYQRFNVLVCTTIIETGIDIANVNTIIIEQADNFGLAQLHQLRGRVGRSYHQAYAYLLTSPKKVLSQDAKKRLESIASLEDLGVGFVLATHDLEIRGAGELLGEDQSGQIETIGFSLYMEFLKSAIDTIKKGGKPSLDNLPYQMTEIELQIPMLLPEEYIPDVNTRLFFYKRIANVENDYEIEDIRMELINRFGLLPDPAQYLLSIANLRQRSKNLGIQRIEVNDKGGLIEFNPTNRIDPTYFIRLLTKEAETYRLDESNRLKFICDLANRTTRLQYIDRLLREFQKNVLSN
ncbi:Transcription-repair-coupling factor [Candidatus Gullanella endobia]|uniref:Transcription-repair-coupling factor n=1 Tax=Candidatus Gullanella endobia TaxID=1070130 RepID=A0A143WRE2_9ENTR|nr:transcription-repair coupling factor [Candidatus Gullanella endobia]CUX96315.1 Transcription-repair-coupling factor [Candidatus Gullanella endobia]